MKTDKPRLCIAGNLLGRTPGYVTTQGQIIADLFLKDGFDVVSVSSKPNRLLRLADLVWTIFRNSQVIDVLILEVYSGAGFILADSASFLSKLFRIPAIFVLHGGNLPEFTDKYPNWVSRILRRAEILVAPSSFLAREMAQYGFQVRVIPNVLALDTYPSKLRQNISPKLLWMRSFHPIYNPQMALDAFAAVKRENPDATLVMAGADKGLENNVKNSARQMGLKDSVRFPGFLDENSKIKEFSDADVYLNTNRIDNMPVSVIEACAMGLPVVATDVGGVSHLITNGENGLLVPDGDSNKMADAIRTLLKNPDLTEQLSRKGRLLAENSAWTSVRTSWEELFAEISARKRRTKREKASINL
jgi:L-malate glycosyltransferase